MACAKGKIMRVAYKRKIRKSGKVVSVKAHCIKDRGLPGKGPQLITGLKKGELKKFGYSSAIPVTARHTALKRAVRSYGNVSVIRKLNAVKVLNRNTNPKVSRVFGADLAWVEKSF